MPIACTYVRMREYIVKGMHNATLSYDDYKQRNTNDMKISYRVGHIEQSTVQAERLMMNKSCFKIKIHKRTCMKKKEELKDLAANEASKKRH